MAHPQRHTIVRRSHSDVAAASAPTIDQAVVDSIARLADQPVEKYVKPGLEEFLLQRHNLSPENYPEDLNWVVNALNNYVTLMEHGKNPTPVVQGEQVGRLNLAFIRALRSKDALVVFDAVLWFFSYHEDKTFRDELPYRGVHMHKFGSGEATQFFTHMLAVSQMIADMETRHKRLRELDFHGAIRNIPKGFEKQATGLTTFIDYYTHF